MSAGATERAGVRARLGRFVQVFGNDQQPSAEGAAGQRYGRCLRQPAQRLLAGQVPLQLRSLQTRQERDVQMGNY